MTDSLGGWVIEISSFAIISLWYNIFSRATRVPVYIEHWNKANCLQDPSVLEGRQQDKSLVNTWPYGEITIGKYLRRYLYRVVVGLTFRPTYLLSSRRTVYQMECGSDKIGPAYSSLGCLNPWSKRCHETMRYDGFLVFRNMVFPPSGCRLCIL